jgi:hypothetical protein
MIDVRTAVQIAADYVAQFSDYFPPREIRLEETEFVDPGYWDVTLSFLDNAITERRSYKIFRIDAESGDVRFMKARAVLGIK